MTVIQDEFRNFVSLSSIFYVFELEVNLLSEKQMCEMRLYESFDQHNLYIQNKHNRIMIKVSEQNEVYIVKHIAKNLNKFVLLSVMHTLFNLKIILSATKLNTNL